MKSKLIIEKSRRILNKYYYYNVIIKSVRVIGNNKKRENEVVRNLKKIGYIIKNKIKKIIL